MASPPEPTRLMLVLEVGDGAGERLAAALAAAKVGAVLIEVAGSGAAAPRLAPLVAAARTAGASAVVGGSPEVVRVAGADGIHVTTAHHPVVDDEAGDVVVEARRVLGGGAVVGVEAAGSRHRAMTAAEAGADYIAFAVGADADDEAREARLDLVAWWAEIFETPCVAIDVGSPDEAFALAVAGADLVAVRVAGGLPPAEIAERVRAMAAALADAAHAERAQEDR